MSVCVDDCALHAYECVRVLVNVCQCMQVLEYIHELYFVIHAFNFFSFGNEFVKFKILGVFWVILHV